MDVNQFISDHGAWSYLAVIVLTFIEGETPIIFAGFLAAQGSIDPVLLLGSAWLGSFFGDQCYFWLGRRFGPALLDRFPRWRQGVDTALRWLQRFDAGFILSFRFIYGVRNVSSFAMGLSAIGWYRFLWLNFAAAGLWAASFVSVGYFLGHACRALFGDLSLVMLAVVAAIIGAIWLLHRHQRRRHITVPAGAKPIFPPT
jgi:membrane protein DedA with SNARE-associated domain